MWLSLQIWKSDFTLDYLAVRLQILCGPGMFVVHCNCYATVGDWIMHLWIVQEKGTIADLVCAAKRTFGKQSVMAAYDLAAVTIVHRDEPMLTQWLLQANFWPSILGYIGLPNSREKNIAGNSLPSLVYRTPKFHATRGQSLHTITVNRNFAVVCPDF